jgi:hypothetical protein
MKHQLLSICILYSAFAISCGSSSDKSDTDSGETDSNTEDISSDSNSDSDTGLSKTEITCNEYIADETLDSILKADMYANDYSSGLGECDYKKVDTTDDNSLQGTQVRITKKDGSDYFDSQKQALDTDGDFQKISDLGDDAFVTSLLGWSSIYVFKDNISWFISLYTGDTNLIPELADLYTDYTDENIQKVKDKKLSIIKELATAVVAD